MKPFSRRSFLKGLSTSALAGAAQNLRTFAADVPTATPEAHTLGPGEVPITLDINHTPRQLRVEPRVTLLDALRNRLEYTAAKEVCDRGTCGACTVHIDGRPMYACMVLAVDAVGKKILTAEGVAPPDEPNALQRSFVENDALMCGYCTPGFIMSAKALLDKNPAPTREQIVRSCAGNLCRCGAYPNIVKAIEKAAKGEVSA